MACSLLHHRHGAEDRGVVFASVRGHESSLRHREALATCAFGGHAIFWAVEAADESQALGLLPSVVAERATAIRRDRCASHEDLGSDL